MKRKELHKLFLSKDISIDNYDKSVDIVELNASKQEWQKFIDIALLFLGGTFFIVGMIFFFAYNWENLNKFVKLAIPFSILTLSIWITLKYELDSLVPKASLFVAIIAVGLEFTLFGQIYQTGADAWNLFFAWSLFCVGFVFISKSSIHWVVWFVIANVALTLFIIQTTNYNPIKFLMFFTVIGVLFFSFMLEVKKLKNFKWLQETTVIYFLVLFILLLSSNYSYFFKYLIFYIPIALAIFVVFNSSLVVVSSTMLSSIIVSTLLAIKIAHGIESKITFGAIVFITVSIFAINYLKKRISNAETN